MIHLRAAAIEQLKDWVERNKSDFYSGNPNQDPASVAYKAMKNLVKKIINICL